MHYPLAVGGTMARRDGEERGDSLPKYEALIIPTLEALKRLGGLPPWTNWTLR